MIFIRIRSIVLLLAAVSLGCQAPADSDYLSPELRSDVERLKLDVLREPTSPETLAERTDLVWAWANAYSMTGGPVPVNLPLEVTVVRWGVADGTPPDEPVVDTVPMFTPRYLCTVIDGYVRELALKDERPDALGSLSIGAPEPPVAGRYCTIEQTWTAGEAGMAEGGSLMLGRQWMGDLGDLQVDDPVADNYVSVRCSNPAARFKAILVPLWGMHGGFMTTSPSPAFRLTGTSLAPGDTITVVFGDRSHASAGLRMQSFSSDQLLLPVYLDLEASGNFLTPTWPGIEVLGGDVERVEVHAPSVVAVGEPFHLTVRSTDGLHNTARGPVPGYVVRLNNETVATIPGDEDAVTRVRDLSIDTAGVYRFAVDADDGSVGAVSNPVWVREAPERRIYWGETHGHTDFAEGQGSPEAYYRFARDQVRLDFAVLSEHDFWMDDSEWRTMQELVREFTDEGRFVAYLGYEWTALRSRGGHHNVYFRRPDAERVPIQEAHRLKMLYQGLHATGDPEDALIIPHAHMAGDWTQSDPDLERLVEIYSCHGSFEWFGNLYLRNGFEIGFVAASDDHRSRPGVGHGNWSLPLTGIPGLAAVLAPAKTIDAVFDGLRGLRSYATSGARIILDATVNGYGVGTRQPDTERRHIVCRVMGTSPVDSIDVIRNGEVVFSRSYLEASAGSHASLLLSFASTSDVFTPDRTDNPRPRRLWSGSFELRRARLRSVEGIGLDNRIRDRFEIDPVNPNRVRFHIETRGRADSLLLELEGASEATEILVELEPTTELGLDRPGFVRGAAELPGERFVLGLDDMDGGKAERSFAVGEHVDRVSLQVVDPDAPLDRELEYVDTNGVAPGDYYYLRVTQLDGHQAWSSPIWVGTRGDNP
jgi:hypothetical protein